MIKIIKHGDGMDLRIADITHDHMVRMEKECTFFGKFYWRKSLQRLWYLKDKKMQQLFGVSSFREMQSGDHRYMGPLLAKKTDLDAFLKQIQIYQNNQPIDIDSTRLKVDFEPAPTPPAITDDNVLVFHGELYKGETIFTIPDEESFALRHLRLNLVDCGKNGFIFQSVSYRGEKYFGSETAQDREFLRLLFIAK